MEKRQLDFNAPLLSARRFSSPRNSSELVQRKLIEKRPPPGRHQSLPLNISDWESEDITRPASVPFHWEQAPGRPKIEAQTRLPPSNTPRLPPGRLSGPSKFVSGERSYDQNITSFTDHASLLEKLGAALDESDSESDDDEEEECSDTFSDALSVTETCSGGKFNSVGKPSGKFCVDKQTRDFMMNRFLPAAKAAVLETPQYVSKKSAVLSEEVKDVVKHSVRKYSSDVIVPYYGPGFDNVESEDEDSGVPVKKTGKSWGILPRICARSTMCLFNQVPGMKSKSRPPTPSAGEERRLRRNSVSGPLDKNGSQIAPKKKYHSGLLSHDLLGLNNKSSNDRHSLLSSRQSPRSELSPLRRYRSGSLSPCRNESPKPPSREGPRFLGAPNKELDNFNASKIASSRKMFKALQDVSKYQINDRVPKSSTLDPVEKTVYVDSVNKKIVVRSDKEAAKGKKTSSKYADDVRDIDRESRTVDRDFEVGTDVKSEIGVEKQLVLFDNVGGECDLPWKSALPPPLLKSPSESWLSRTLPSIPLSNPFAHSRRSGQLESAKKPGPKGSSNGTKWETIVKSSKLRHDHARYSEELVPHASYRQKKS